MVIQKAHTLKCLTKLLQGSYQHKARDDTTGGWFMILTKPVEPRLHGSFAVLICHIYVELGRHTKEQKYLYVAHKSVTDSNIE